MLLCSVSFQRQPLYKLRLSKFCAAIEVAFLTERDFLSQNRWGALTAEVCK